MATIRDWHNHGIDIKVELATAGTLVLGGLKAPEPFIAGGPDGAPQGFTLSVYNQPPTFTPINSTTDTALNRWSISIKTPTSYNANFYTYFIWKNYNVVQGKRYQMGVRYRTMDTKDKANVMCRIEYQRASDQSWQYLTGVATVDSVTDWTDVLLTTSGIPAGPNGQSKIRVMLGGSATLTVPQDQAQNWGVQFDNLYWVPIDADTVPLEWHDISCDVRALTVRYGRERFTNRYDVSSLSVELNNDEGEYAFREVQPLGLRPGRQVRVTATHEGVTYPMAFHVIDSMKDSYSIDGRVIATWDCVDPSTLLSDQTVSTGVNIARLAAPRLNELVDQVGYQNRRFDAGQWTFQPIKDSGRSIRDEAGLMGDSEGGSFFADREGYLVYKDRTWLTTDPNLLNATAQFLACDEKFMAEGIDPIPTLPNAPVIQVSELDTDWSLARVINIVSLANAGGNAQEFIDNESLEAHGPHTYQRHDFILSNDVNLPTRANDLMAGYADARLRVNTASFAPGVSARTDPDVWPFTLSLFLNWVVRVWYVHPTETWGYVIATHCQSVAHRITATNWETTVALDQPLNYADVDFSDMGWDSAMWDVDVWDEITGESGAIWSSGDKWSDPLVKWHPAVASSLWGSGVMWGDSFAKWSD